jgi:hypothetical protein
MLGNNLSRKNMDLLEPITGKDQRIKYCLTSIGKSRIIYQMNFLNRLHNIISRRLYRRAIALVQLLVMVMLVVPVCCYELGPEQGKSAISLTAGAIDVDHDECPCCPDENKTDADSCSTCSYCSYYAPLKPELATNHVPPLAQLDFREQFTKLPDVHIPIFVPPENFA